MIIGLAGKAGVGKTELARILAARLGFLKESFADALRLEVVQHFGIPMRVLTSRAGKEDCVVLLGHNVFSVRRLLQWWGGIRREGDPDYWVNLVVDTAIRRDRITVIDDVRYQNEADAIRAAGGIVIRLETYPGWTAGVGADHISETDLDDYAAFDLIVYPEYGALPQVADKIESAVLHMMGNYVAEGGRA